MLVLATVGWGLSFPIIKTLALLQAQLFPDAGTWFSASYLVAPRFALGFLVLLLWQGRKLSDLTSREIRQGVIIGLFSAIGMLLQNDGLQFTAASTSAFLTQFYAILIPVYLALRSRRLPQPVVWVSCTLVLLGVAILGKFNWRTLHFGRGEWETLLASTFFVGQILALEKAEFAANRAMKVTLVMFATQAVIYGGLVAILAPNAHSIAVPWTSSVWVALTVVLTVVCTLGAYGLMNVWQPKITATEAGLIYCAEPLFASSLALFLPAMLSHWAGVDYGNETTTWTLLLGGTLITLANVLIQLNPLSAPPKASIPP
jgi:drug/metabolite transporter (DMT)-like permease